MFKKTQAIAEIRQSQVVSSWGPGAIADLRGGLGSPISVLMTGLDEWGEAGLKHKQAIHEPRLEQDLRVRGFRMPPVGSGSEHGAFETTEQRVLSDVLPVVRFPLWYQCQNDSCGRLRLLDPTDDAFRRAVDKKGHVVEEYYCAPCTGGAVDDEGNPEYKWVAPARLIVACETGHLTEFPWREWARCGCPDNRTCDLRVEQRFAGLAGRFVRCNRCQPLGGGQSLDGAFSAGSLKAIHRNQCFSREPWLRPAAGTASSCTKDVRVLQRGASNVYWTCLESSLSIPPHTTPRPNPLALFGTFEEGIREGLTKVLAGTMKLEELKAAAVGLTAFLGRSGEECHQAIDAAISRDSERPPDVRDREGRKWEEYLAFSAARKQRIDEPEFSVESSMQDDEVDLILRSSIEAVLLVPRLREVRAQTAFTRIRPPSEGGDRGRIRRRSPKSGSIHDWLPAAEIRGEGIMVILNEEAVTAWEQQPEVAQRYAHYLKRLEVMPPDFQPPKNLSSRLLLLHSLSHTLMRGLSLECGYSSASLAERIFAGPTMEHPDRRMSGLLIYTGSPDSGGTLGGLVRRGRREFISTTILNALHDARWCSTDPLCITGAASMAVPTNHAACHGCLLAPETSCEFPFFNGYLDRALLVGTPDCPELGFFSELLATYDESL
jgi:hypothetical protein